MPLLELKSGRIVMVGSKQANNYGNLVLNSFKKCEYNFESILTYVAI